MVVLRRGQVLNLILNPLLPYGPLQVRLLLLLLSTLGLCLSDLLYLATRYLLLQYLLLLYLPCTQPPGTGAPPVLLSPIALHTCCVVGQEWHRRL